MINLNQHINVGRIPYLTAKKYSVTKYEDSCIFDAWLKSQPVRYPNAEAALKAWNGQDVEMVEEDKPKFYQVSEFKSRQQLNSFLRRNGYCWHKTYYSEEDLDAFGPNAANDPRFRSSDWQLFSSDNRVVTVEQALQEIGR